jgi:hypothetical protein
LSSDGLCGTVNVKAILHFYVKIDFFVDLTKKYFFVRFLAHDILQPIKSTLHTQATPGTSSGVDTMNMIPYHTVPYRYGTGMLVSSRIASLLSSRLSSLPRRKHTVVSKTSCRLTKVLLSPFVILLWASRDPPPAAGAKDDSTRSAKSKFIWHYKTKEQSGNPGSERFRITYPFLDDNNEQDYLFSTLLQAEAPYAGRFGSIGRAWDDFTNKLVLTEAKDGSFPFEGIAQNTAKARLQKYKELAL